ncbi:hypothetical protein M408DRAFT_330328 [Serendipita vermifera MAFF 305830]|uniref:Rab-GAP TBC domain-containing protein n=1 Tax=Serendipita vermifera MAFF 305830 TaxID=933852 RepID=A0A0C3B660_SERVB|nr:hypothetical protein M408DRAFT_330328 [Serendipita vermifera MAFF 305830]
MATKPLLKSTSPAAASNKKPDVLHLTTPSPSAAAAEQPDARSPVDALLSPTTTDERPLTSSSASAANAATVEDEKPETQDVVVDDERFSTVPLSATAVSSPQEPLALAASTTSSLADDVDRPATQRSSISSTTNMEVSLLTPRTSMSATLASGHASAEKGKLGLTVGGDQMNEGGGGGDGTMTKKRRPASLVSPVPNSTTSTGNPAAEFILAKLEKDMMSPTAKSMRASLDGKNILQAEFDQARKAKQVDDDAESITADGINWDFWGNVMNDYETFARNEPKKLARAIEAGIPPTLRGMLWQLMSASKDTDLEQIYQNLLKEKSPHEKAITRDLGRTFPHHAFFNDGQGVGQESLFNVLKAYSLFDPECGYCQGLPFIVAPLLLVCPDEEAFCLLVRLMQSYELRLHFLPEMPGLQMRLFQFDRLIEEMLPVLHIHFLRQGVKSSMFCSQWFMTLFAYRFPLDLVFRIFDHVLATGVDAIFAFSVLLLQKNEQALLKLNFDQILEFLKSSLLDCYKTEEELEDGAEETILVDNFIRDAASMRITPFQLDGFASEYVEMKRAQTAHIMEMETLRNENRLLKARIQKLEDEFTAVETEHCDVINQLVRAKIEKEEYEAELVRFKLLYAELMHQHEDSKSSNRMSQMSRLSETKAVP